MGSTTASFGSLSLSCVWFILSYFFFCYCEAVTHLVILRSPHERKIRTTEMKCTERALTFIILIKHLCYIVSVLVPCTSLSVNHFFFSVNHKMSTCQLAQFSVLMQLPVPSIHRIARLCFFTPPSPPSPLFLCTYSSFRSYWSGIKTLASFLTRVH